MVLCAKPLAGLTVVNLAACTAALKVPAGARIACARSSDCPAGLVCVSGLQICAAPATACITAQGDVYQPAVDGSSCNLADSSGICRSGSCLVSRCGDGTVTTPFEVCEDGNSDSCDGCRDDCTLGCICAAPNPCGATQSCVQGICSCADAAHCGPLCVTCSGELSVCGGTSVGCVCDLSPAPRGSCHRGSRCSGHVCAPCADACYCGQECVPCSGNTPVCGGAQAGCVASNCSGQPDFTCSCRSSARSSHRRRGADGPCLHDCCSAVGMTSRNARVRALDRDSSSSRCARESTALLRQVEQRVTGACQRRSTVDAMATGAVSVYLKLTLAARGR